MAGSHLEIFSTLFEEGDTPEFMHKVRSELAPIKVRVEGFDIYNKKVSVKRALEWFVQHGTD